MPETDTGPGRLPSKRKAHTLYQRMSAQDIEAANMDQVPALHMTRTGASNVYHGLHLLQSARMTCPWPLNFFLANDRTAFPITIPRDRFPIDRPHSPPQQAVRVNFGSVCADAQPATVKGGRRNKNKALPTTVGNRNTNNPSPTTGENKNANKPLPTTGENRNRPRPLSTAGGNRSRPLPTTGGNTRKPLPIAGGHGSKPLPIAGGNRSRPLPIAGGRRPWERSDGGMAGGRVAEDKTFRGKIFITTVDGQKEEAKAWQQPGGPVPQTRVAPGAGGKRDANKKLTTSTVRDKGMSTIAEVNEGRKSPRGMRTELKLATLAGTPRKVSTRGLLSHPFRQREGCLPQEDSSLCPSSPLCSLVCMQSEGFNTSILFLNIVYNCLNLVLNRQTKKVNSTSIS